MRRGPAAVHLPSHARYLTPDDSAARFRYLLLPALPALLALQHGPPPPDPDPDPVWHPGPAYLPGIPPPGAWVGPWRVGRAWANALAHVMKRFEHWLTCEPRWAVTATTVPLVLVYVLGTVPIAVLLYVLAAPVLGWTWLRAGRAEASRLQQRFDAWLTLLLMGLLLKRITVATS